MRCGFLGVAMPRLVSVALLLALAVPPRAAWGMDPYELYAQKLELAEAAAKRGDSAGAVEAYVVAYESLPGGDRATPLGGDVVDRVNRLAQEAFLDGSKDRHMLEQARTLLEAHIRDLQRFAPGTDVAPYEEKKRRIEAALSTLTVNSPGGTSDAPREPLEPQGDPATQSDAARLGDETSSGGNDAGGVQGPSSRGVGFTIGGVAALGAGVSMLAYGGWSLTQRIPDGFAENEAECERVMGDTPGSIEQCLEDSGTNEWRDQQQRISYALVGVGAVAAAAGVAMIAAGAVFLVKDRRGRNVAQLMPVPAAYGSGLALLGRF